MPARTRDPMSFRLIYFLMLSVLICPLRAEDEIPSAFGSQTNPGGALIGILYDLKQTQKRQPVDPHFLQIYHEFIRSGWDENVLSPFFRGTRPVYAAQIFVPNMGAAAAPKAFHIEEIVRPTQWLVIYKGQVSPPEDGVYRFVGVADDIMAVAVDGQTVLVSNFGSGEESPHWKPPEPKAAVPGGPYTMQRGDWFNARRDRPIDLDVLVGEYPGNLFGAWLLIEKQGVEYPVINDPRYGKRAVLPLFQVESRRVDAKAQPVPFSSDGPVWNCHQ